MDSPVHELVDQETQDTLNSLVREELVQEYHSSEELSVEGYLRDLDIHIPLPIMFPSPLPQDNIGPIEIDYITDLILVNFNSPLTKSQFSSLFHDCNFDNRSHISHTNPLY